MVFFISCLCGIAVMAAFAAGARGIPAIVRLLKIQSEGRIGPGRRPAWPRRLFQGRRLRRLRDQLPGAVGAIATGVRAGLSLPQALTTAAGQVAAPAGEELRNVVRDTRLGAPLDAALEGFERRVPLPEARLLVSGLKLSRSTGGNLTPLLDRLGETLRERERLRGQFRTLTAQARLSGWVVGLIPVVLLVLMSLIDPEFVRPLWETGAGWTMLGIALILETLGVLAIRAIVRVEP